MSIEKSQAELEIEALADVFGIATTGFEEFYKKTKDSVKGDYSKAGSVAIFICLMALFLGGV